MKRGLFGPVTWVSTEMKSMTTKVAKQIPNWPQVGYVAVDKISFLNANKNFRVARKKGRSGNRKHISILLA